MIAEGGLSSYDVAGFRDFSGARRANGPVGLSGDPTRHATRNRTAGFGFC